MITKYRKQSRFKSVFSCIALFMMAGLGLTNAVPQDQNLPAAADVSGLQPPGDAKANEIIRPLPVEANPAVPNQTVVVAKPQSAVLRLRANKDGTLRSISLNETELPIEDDVFGKLSLRMQNWANEQGRPPLDQRVLEIDADENLNYELIKNAIAACTVSGNPQFGELEIVKRVRFAQPPKETLELTVGFLRDASGHQLSEQVIVIVGDKVIRLDAVEIALREWLEQHPVPPKEVTVQIRSDPDVTHGSVQSLIQAAEKLKFEKFTLRLLQPAEHDGNTITSISLKRIKASEAATLLQQFFEDRGPVIVPDQKTNSIVVTANAQDMKALMRIVERLDKDTSWLKLEEQIEVIQLSQLDAKSAARALTQIFPEPEDGAGPVIEVDVRANRLVVKCDEATLRLIKRVLVQLGENTDAKPAQPVPPAERAP